MSVIFSLSLYHFFDSCLFYVSFFYFFELVISMKFIFLWSCGFGFFLWSKLSIWHLSFSDVQRDENSQWDKMNPFPLTPRPSPKRHITRQLLLISSARVTGHEYLEASMPDINQFLKPYVSSDHFEIFCFRLISFICFRKNVTKILFIPYAVRNYDDYVERVSVPLRKSGNHHNSLETIFWVHNCFRFRSDRNPQTGQRDQRGEECWVYLSRRW